MPWKSNPEWWNSVFYVLLSAAGGTLGYLFRQLTGNVKISWLRSLIEGAGAGFVGYPTYMVCQAMNFSSQWTGVVVSVCGWLGATVTIGLLQKVVTNKLGAKDP